MSNDCSRKIKTCFIGFGKRTKLFYAPILKKLKDDFELCGFTKKTQNNVNDITKDYEIDFYESTESLLEKARPDLIILSVPSGEVLKILNKLKNSNCVIFADTPFYWGMEDLNNLNILVLI